MTKQRIFRSPKPVINLNEVFLNPDVGLTLSEIGVCCIITGLIDGNEQAKRYMGDLSDEELKWFTQNMRDLRDGGVLFFEESEGYLTDIRFSGDPEYEE